MGKGRRIALEGRIQTGSYTAQDGSKRYTTDVILDRFDFIDSRNDGGYGQGSGGNFQSANNAAPAGGQNGGMSMDDVDSDFHLMADDDDLPF